MCIYKYIYKYICMYVSVYIYIILRIGSLLIVFLSSFFVYMCLYVLWITYQHLYYAPYLAC